MTSWKSKHPSPTSVFSEIPKVRIERTPPEDNGDKSLVMNYHQVVDELEQLYTEYVKDANSGNATLRETLDGYDEKRDELFARLSQIFSERDLDSSGVGGMIQEHQNKLEEAAFKEIERLAKMVNEKRKMKEFLDKGM